MKNTKAVNYSINTCDLTELNDSSSVEGLIGLFEDEINSAITIDSLEYEHTQKAIHIFHGTPKSHKCQYKIVLADVDLGQITLTRQKPFEEDEMIIVERALGALTMHLHNFTKEQPVQNPISDNHHMHKATVLS